MITVTHPAFVDGSFEFFNTELASYQLTEGDFKVIGELPQHFIDLLKEHLSSDKTAQRGLDKLGIYDKNDRIEKFYVCNYSAADNSPDIDVNGRLGKKEYVKCNKRGLCPAEGETCRFPGGLTKKEVEVIKCIALGFSDAQICYELDIAQDTLRNHKNNIERKILKKAKPAMAAWAVENNII